MGCEVTKTAVIAVLVFFVLLDRIEIYDLQKRVKYLERFGQVRDSGDHFRDLTKKVE